MSSPPGKVLVVRSVRLIANPVSAQPSLAVSLTQRMVSGLATPGQSLLRSAPGDVLAFRPALGLTIGRRMKGVAPGTAWRSVQCVTAANEIRWSNLEPDRPDRSELDDDFFFVALGPRLLDARKIKPDKIRLSSWVNDELVEDFVVEKALGASIHRVLAAISDQVSLDPGDTVICPVSSTPTTVVPCRLVEVELTAGEQGSTGRLRTPIMEAPADSIHNPAGRSNERERQVTNGRDPRRDATADFAKAKGLAYEEALGQLQLSTLEDALRARGIHPAVLAGVRSVSPSSTLIGRARTLRCLPWRADLVQQRQAAPPIDLCVVESLQPGDVLVVSTAAGCSPQVLGDVLATRASARGAIGVVTDGAVRDLTSTAAMGLAVFQSVAPGTGYGPQLPWEFDTTVACGAVLVQPGDLIYGDADGVIVVPRELISEVLQEAAERQRRKQSSLGRPVSPDGAVHTGSDRCFLL